MRLNPFTGVLFVGTILTCMKQKPVFDFQGHRGARGLMPENTIPGFHKALELGVTTLELDLCVSAEGELIISHEPWFSWEIATHPDSSIQITRDNERQFNLYRMTYDEIARFDVGLKPHPRFPEQMKIPAVKPRFSDMVREIEARVKKEKRPPVWYNIETKSMPEGDGIFHPDPETFTDIVLKEINQLGIADRVIVQSFDLRTLVAMHRKSPKIKLALLVESAGELPQALETLGFVPDIYSPNHEDLTEEWISLAKAKKMKVIPWTVNDTARMQQLVNLGVDGLISDYPDRFKLLSLKR
jgi:glycerophosphoryl diester phosphodiesterase